MSRLTAGQRLQRLLSLVPWVVAQDGPRIEEVCSRFDIAEEDLLADLDTVFLVGLHPFSPDELIEVVIDDGRVWIRYADMFARPLRLTPGEGLALVAAGSGLLASPGADPEGPLARGLAKLAAVLGVDPARALEIELGRLSATTYDLLQEAVRGSRQIEIDYYTFGRDERTRRTIEPWRVFSDRGQWYVVGHCHQAGGERIFRLDRISEARLLSATFTPPADEPPAAVPDLAAGESRAVLDLEPAGRWVAEAYPVEEVVDRGGGRLRVTLRVGARRWLERLLLRLGPEATLVEIDPRLGGPGVGAEAALRVLARYGGATPSR